MEYKVNDVFKFRFNKSYIENCVVINPYHCFDGQLIVKDKGDGTLLFYDTYYSTPKYFTFEELNKIGTFKFVCNLDDVIDCSELDKRYYKEEDIIDLSYQHGYYKWFVKKKTAKRSREVMLEYIANAIAEDNRKIKNLKDDIERYKEKESLINDPNTNLEEIYLPII